MINFIGIIGAAIILILFLLNETHILSADDLIYNVDIYKMK